MNRLRYGAREYDAETGLYYNRARYYDPKLQRFLSPDPIGLAGGVNWYAYAGNDPVNARDPSGLGPFCEGDAIHFTHTLDTNWGTTVTTSTFVPGTCTSNAPQTGPVGPTGPGPGPGGTPSGPQPPVTPNRPVNQCAQIDGFLGAHIAEAQRLKALFDADVHSGFYLFSGGPAGPVGALLLSFSSRVEGGGPWDMKLHGETPWFGNWHYGVVGAAAGLSPATLLRAAGANQQYGASQVGQYDTRNGHFSDRSPSFYGDTPLAQQNIRDGIAWYNRGCR